MPHRFQVLRRYLPLADRLMLAAIVMLMLALAVLLVVLQTMPLEDGGMKSVLMRYRVVSLFSVCLLASSGILLIRFILRLRGNLRKLRAFASKADHNERIELEELAQFPTDELGEISEHIIKLYVRLQRTKNQQNVLKRQLTQNIAHELKTPIASIEGYLETILRNPDLPADQRTAFINRCFAQSNRLSALVQDISTLNRLDDGLSNINFVDVDISALVKEIMEQTHLQLQERHMTFQNNLPKQLIVKGNHSLLYSIFRNLTDNAIAYAGYATTITLSATHRTDGKWLFIFADNGVGVADEHLQRIFERFYRVDKGRSRKLGGTGLGLAIVRNAVVVHGGSIHAEHNPTGGLRFVFTIAE